MRPPRTQVAECSTYGGRGPSGTRGIYRIDAPAYDGLSGVVQVPLYGNQWPLRQGERIRFDVTQVDAPTFRPDNQASTLTFSAPTLTLPTRQASTTTLSAISG